MATERRFKGTAVRISDPVIERLDRYAAEEGAELRIDLSRTAAAERLLREGLDAWEARRAAGGPGSDAGRIPGGAR